MRLRAEALLARGRTAGVLRTLLARRRAAGREDAAAIIGMRRGGETGRRTGLKIATPVFLDPSHSLIYSAIYPER